MFSENKLSRIIIAALFILGFTSILVQLVLIREMLNLFQGNELIIGFIFCLWMLLTAAGAGCALRIFRNVNKYQLISRLFALEAIVPVIVVGLLSVVDSLLFPPGTTRGLIIALVYCLVFLLPGCFVSGLLFARLASLLSESRNTNCVSLAYGWESVGSMLAGILFSLLLAFLLRTFQVLSLAFLCNLVAACLLHPEKLNKFKKVIVSVSCIVVTALLFLMPADIRMKSLHYKNEQILYTRDTPFQHVTVTESNGQVNYYGNNMLLFSSNNPNHAEEAVHYALLQHQAPEKVLIVSGGIADMSAQVFKYNSVETLHYLEIDPWLVKAEKEFTNIPEFPGMEIFHKDVRQWIRNSTNWYDVIIINSPDPSNAQINRYYTLDFFKQAQKALTPHGIFSISLNSTANYMSTEAREVNRIVFQTLQEAFACVEIIPGGRNYFVASDASLGLNIADRLQKATLENDYVTPYSIDDELLLFKNRQLLTEISEPVALANTDLTPVAYLHQIRYWIYMGEGSKSTEILWVSLIIISSLVLFAARKTNPYSAGVFTTGFAGTSSEFLVLMVYQSLFGNIYQMTGLIIALYMLGLTFGAIIRSKPGSNTKRYYARVQVVIIVLVAFIPVVFKMAASSTEALSWAVQGTLFTLITAIAFMAGLAFNKATVLAGSSFITTASNLYAIDLAGAALGILLTSTLLLPLLGMWATCILLSVLVLAGLLILHLFGKSGNFVQSMQDE
ncbi:MAG: methyltransferase [Bacteroidales bacterium]|nr:methyltransferase [Bacteroidales bacterium]